MWRVDIDKEAVLLSGYIFLIHEDIPLNALRNWLRGVQHPLPISERLRTLQRQKHALASQVSLIRWETTALAESAFCGGHFSIVMM
jgi:hypothetical protein